MEVQKASVKAFLVHFKTDRRRAELPMDLRAESLLDSQDYQVPLENCTAENARFKSLIVVRGQVP